MIIGLSKYHARMCLSTAVTDGLKDLVPFIVAKHNRGFAFPAHDYWTVQLS